MTPQEALAALRQAWFEGVEPGPWHPAHRPGGPIVLDNANGDSIFVDADDAATLVNILADDETIVFVPSFDLWPKETK